MKKDKIRMEDLPVYEITFEDDGNQGIRMVSLVKDPAIELKGMYFSADDLEKEKEFQFKSIPDKQIVVGYAMLPNKKILRKDKNDNPYFVVFSAETILKMANKFNKENSNKDINVDHSDAMVPGFIQANWITENAQYDKMKMYGFSPYVGGWAVEMKIEDAKFWETAVKEEGRYSFSIEGLMGQEPMDMEKDFCIDEVIDSLSDNELYELFISIDDIPVHPNCRCEIDMDLWVIMPDACDDCRDAQAEFNAASISGDMDFAMQIFKKHRGEYFSSTPTIIKTPKEKTVINKTKKKISFDYDGTLDRPDVQEIAKKKIKEGYDVYILTKNKVNKKNIEQTAKELCLAPHHIIYTEGKSKYNFLKQHEICEHWDDMQNEIDEIKAKTSVITHKV